MTSSSDQHGLRIGLDLGGSKIEGILLGPGAKEWARYRVATPRDDYAATIVAIVDLTARLMQGIAPGAKILNAHQLVSNMPRTLLGQS